MAATVANQIVNCRDKVEAILKRHPEARECDKILWSIYLANNHDLIRVLGMDSFRKLQEVLRNPKVPSVETLGRLRRRFQERGQYLAKDPKRKKHQAKRVKEALAYID
jgi:hypothetical protein